VLALPVPDESDDGTDATDTAQARREDDADYRRFGRPDVLAAVTSGELTDEEHKRAGEEVRKLGGLYILGTERHESRRIDNQLRGRAGRQGDPGESKFFVSMEDELMRLFGDRANSPLLRTWEEHLMMDMPLLSKMIERAQKKVEEYYFESRKNVLNYDDVMNRQRELIYKERRRILNGVNLRDTILTYVEQTIAAAVDVHIPAAESQSEWDLDGLYTELNGIFVLEPAIVPEDFAGKSREEITAFITDHVTRVYEAKEQELEATQGEGTMRELERWLALRAVNNRWMEHLANMDYLREGIGLRGYEQKDPLLIYQKEAFDEFERMQQAIQDDIVSQVFHASVSVEPQPMLLEQQATPLITLPSLQLGDEDDGLDKPVRVRTNRSNGKVVASDDEAPADWKGGRNDPCWCGSGQKYKKCHGK
jgi:preprotein translocase subunit SecA